MIKDNLLTSWLKEQEVKHSKSWLVVLFAQPSVYLFTLLKKTCIIGFILLVIYLILEKLGIKEQVLPNTFHSVVGVVIGLLLVFRVSTAYDRWWEARKLFASFHAAILYLKTIQIKYNKQESDSALLKINESFFDYCASISVKEISACKNAFLKNLNLLDDYFKVDQSAINLSMVEKHKIDILAIFTSVERIKDTPIPQSYSLHIKISIMSYILSLPLGLFHEFGYGSIPFAMFIYFVIGGIEVISNEIENPFQQAPNDLPLKDYMDENKKYIHEQGTTKES